MRRSFVLFLLGLLLSPLPYLRALLDPDSALLYRDLTNVQIPLKSEWIAAVSQLMRVPFWDHFHLAGIPFLADASYGPLYPLNFLLLPFSPASVPRALLYFIVLHHMALFAGGFWLARELKARPSVCFVGGIAFAWCGFAMSTDNLLHLLGSQLSAPLAIVFWLRELKRPQAGPALAGCALALAWPIYAGDPQFALMSFLGCAILAILRRRGVRKLVPLALLAALASGPQLLPIAFHLRDGGSRIADATLEAQTIWRLHPVRLLELVFPSPFVSTPEENPLRGAALVNGPHGGAMPFLFSFYAGAVPAAALALYLALRIAKRSRRRIGILYAAVPVVMVALLATASPLYSVFYRFIPLWRGFRYPERLGYWLVAPLIVGGICATERLLRLRARGAKFGIAAPVIAIWLLGGVALAAGGALEAVAQGVVAATATLALFALPLPVRRHEALLGVVAALDFFFSAQRLVWPQSLALLDPGNLPLARQLLAHESADRDDLARGGPRRLISFYESQSIDPALLASSSLLALDTAEAWLYLRANIPAYFGFESAFGHGSLVPQREFLRERCENAACEQRVAELLSTRYAIRPGPDGRPAIQRIENTLPFAFVTGRLESAVDARTAFLRARGAGFDFRHSAVVEGDLPPAAPSERQILRVDRGWDRVAVEVGASPAPGLLVVNEAFDGGWSAGAMPVRRVNGWAIGVELPPAAEPVTVTIEYRDRGFYLGCGLWLLWVAGLSGLMVRSRVASGAPSGPRQVRV